MESSKSYGQEEKLENNTYSFRGTTSGQKLYYKIVTVDNIGKVYESSGKVYIIMMIMEM